MEDAIARAVELHGRIDGVANCVGSIVLKAAHATSEAEFDNVIRLNLNSCFHILKSSVKRMMTAGGGSIVFCSSAVARHGIPNHEAIAAAKAGVTGAGERGGGVGINVEGLGGLGGLQRWAGVAAFSPPAHCLLVDSWWEAMGAVLLP